MDAAAAIRAELVAFSEETRRLVARKPDVVRLLAGPVGLYAPGGQWHALRERRSAKPGIQVRGAVIKARRLARAIAALEQLLGDRQVRALLSGGGLAPSEHLISIAAPLAGLRAQAQRITDLAPRRRGRPRDVWRDRFCAAIARALRDVGEPVTKARGGLFADVLACAFVAAGENFPEQLFPLVSRSSVVKSCAKGSTNSRVPKHFSTPQPSLDVPPFARKDG